MKITKQDREWSTEVKLRDGNQCVICGEVERINAHHIVPREIEVLRYDINNGISLCPKHHRFSRKLSAHQNPFTFHIWLEKHKLSVINYLKYRLQAIDLEYED